MRTSFARVGLVPDLVSVVFAAVALAEPIGATAQDVRPALVLHQAVPDAATDTLTIDGEHFGPTPFVTLDLAPLDLRLVLETRLMAAVPIDAMPPGRYLLTVSRGPDAGDRATLEVSLGAVIEPPVSSPAVTPPEGLQTPAPGAPAVVVGDRTITVADVDREWQASDPGS